MSLIEKIKLRKIKNSKKQDTIEAEITSGKITTRASAPSGTSAGMHEAIAFPEKIDVLIKKAEKILIPELLEQDIKEQKSIDSTLMRVDGTCNFSNIGGSVAIAVSTACLKNAALTEKKEVYEYLRPEKIVMPKLLGKCIGGGAHASNSVEIQEFLSIPITDSVKNAMILNKKVHALVGKKLNSKKLDYEGGWIKEITNEGALDVLAESISEISAKTKSEIAMGIDFAASELYKNKNYVYRKMKKNKEEQLKYASELVEKYGLYYIEDAFQEDDFSSFEILKNKYKDVLVCGDDLFTTNKDRLKKGKNSCNSIIIKPNQIGTITQTSETVKLAKSYGYTPVISHRSGETKDSVLADLAVGWQIPFMKIGIVGVEREAKTRRLTQIEKVKK